MTAEIAATAAADLLHEVASRRGGKRERRRADFVEKLDRYVGASTKLASEYAGVKSNVPRGRVGRAFASVSSALNGLTSEHEDMVIGRVLFRKHFERMDALMAEWVEAQTRLGTVAPVPVREAMAGVSELIIRWSNQPGSALTDEWLAAKLALTRAADDFLRPAWRRWLFHGGRVSRAPVTRPSRVLR